MFHYLILYVSLSLCLCVCLSVSPRPPRALADMNKDGKMDRLEFSIAMKLIKLKLQGTPVPSALPIILKQPPVPAPSLNSAYGVAHAVLFTVSNLSCFSVCVCVCRE